MGKKSENNSLFSKLIAGSEGEQSAEGIVRRAE